MHKLDRCIYLDILRIVAVMGTVMIHVACMNWGDALYDSHEWNMMNLFNGISRFSVPLFLMISGALTLSKQYSFNTSVQKIIHRIFNIILWGGIYSIWSSNINPSFGRVDWINCIVSGYGHMWYLWLTIGIIVLQPVLRKISTDKTILQYLICICFICACLLPSFFELFSYLHCTNEYINATINAIGNNFNNSSLNSLSCYVMYYLLGFYISEHVLATNKNKTLYGCLSLILMSGAFTYFVSMFLSNNYAEKIIIYGNYQIGVFFQSVSLFCLVYFNKDYFERLSVKIKKVCISLSGMCYGVYLVHCIVIEILKFKFGMNIMNNSPYVIVKIWLLVMIVSFVISYTIKKIPFLNKILL